MHIRHDRRWHAEPTAEMSADEAEGLVRSFRTRRVVRDVVLASALVVLPAALFLWAASPAGAVTAWVRGLTEGLDRSGAVLSASASPDAGGFAGATPPELAPSSAIAMVPDPVAVPAEPPSPRLAEPLARGAPDSSNGSAQVVADRARLDQSATAALIESEASPVTARAAPVRRTPVEPVTILAIDTLPDVAPESGPASRSGAAGASRDEITLDDLPPGEVPVTDVTPDLAQDPTPPIE